MERTRKKKKRFIDFRGLHCNEFILFLEREMRNKRKSPFPREELNQINLENEF